MYPALVSSRSSGPFCAGFVLALLSLLLCQHVPARVRLQVVWSKIYYAPTRVGTYTGRMAVNPDDPRTPRTQVADALRAGISDGTYAAGTRLPSVRDLAESFGVAPGTVQLALDALRQESLVFSAGNRGNFVSESPAAPPSGEIPPWAVELVGQVEELRTQVQDLTRRVAATEAKR